jgi:hypothetical protein
MKLSTVLTKFTWFVIVPLLINIRPEIFEGYVLSHIDSYYHNYIHINSFPTLTYTILIIASLISIQKFNNRNNNKLRFIFNLIYDGIVNISLKILGSLLAIAIFSILIHDNEVLYKLSATFGIGILLIFSPLWIAQNVINFSDDKESSTLLPRGYKYALYTFTSITIISSFVGLLIEASHLNI